MMAVLGSLFLTGLLGSLGHCLGMCGPLVVMVGLQLQTRKAAAVPSHLLYHGSRLAVYALLGAMAGGIGSILGIDKGLAPVAGIASFVLGLLVILLGMGYLGWLPLGRLEGSGRWLSTAMSRALDRGGTLGVVFLGALNGLLPCGLVYSALLLAATAGGPLRAAAGMAVFGLATVPALLVVGLGAGALSLRWRQTLLRVAGVFIVLVGIQLALRGLAGLDVVSHLKLGGVMIW
ncbi:MAG: sulfite exporter TauE/SafE family protein [Anaerolineae bacterium]|jgi:hypothetical protein